jgi:hypothetical protein
MKTEAEIRQHRDDLKTCIHMPCDCRGTHQEQCFRGMMMMKATIDTLSWILGENEEMAELVNRMQADAAEFRAVQGNVPP